MPLSYNSANSTNQSHLSRKAIFICWSICALGAFFYCYEYLLRISPSVMTQELMRFYHMTGAQYGNLSGSFYYYSYVVMQIIVGLLMDRFGPRRLLTFACALCAVGAYLFACSDQISIAMIGRFLIGLGSSFAFVGAAKLATIWLPPERFALMSGIIFCLGMLGAMFGDIMLRLIVDSTGWQSAIFGAAVVGVIITFILWAVIRDTNPYHANHYSHHTPSLKEVLCGLMIALKKPQIWLAGIVGCLLYLFLTAFAELWGPAYLEQAHGISRSHAVNANSMVFLGCAIGSPFIGWFSDLIQRRRIPVFIFGSISLVVICILLYAQNLPLSYVYALLFLFGFFSSSQILMFAIGRELTPIKISGTTIGLINMLIMVGGVIFPPLVGKVLDICWDGTMQDGARVYSAHAFRVALSVLPIGLILGMVLTYFIRETYCKIFIDEHP
jgi:sugar phosphate permease